MNTPSIRYRANSGVSPIHRGSEILLSTPEGGRVWVDRLVLDLWEAADQCSLDQVLERFHPPHVGRIQTLAGLACLAEAGLLVREGPGDQSPPTPLQGGELVSIILVSYNSLAWLETCLGSIAGQTYPALEIILVDNASKDSSAAWVEDHYPEIKLIRLEQTCSLAQALNQGIRSARGSYYLLLNPDVRLDPEAVAQMVKAAQGGEGSPHPAGVSCAAVAARLRLLWAPSFLNGLGNLVGAISWGTDIGLGRLDLGQFDRWEAVPSACFAAALIPARAMEIVGPLDEGFPMYYEDSEWCYRARLLGLSVRAAPQAVVWHAFNMPAGNGREGGLSPLKLRRVTYGRLRFIARINGAAYFWRFLFNYFVEDFLRGLIYALRGRSQMTHALLLGWLDFWRALPDLRRQRAAIQSRRRISDRSLYQLQRRAPAPLIQAGLPLLTWDVICNAYLPLFLSGRSRPTPEFSAPGSFQNQAGPAVRPRPWARAAGIVRNEGLGRLVQRLGRAIQWRLMQP